MLAFSFVPAALLTFRFSNPAVRPLLQDRRHLARLSQLLLLGVAPRLAGLVLLRVSHLAANPAAVRPILAGILYAIAAFAGIYGLISARVIRIRRIPVQLPNLPASWRGRRAVLLSDLHLGPINGARFCRRLVAMATRLSPDVVFIPGDLFDGTHADLDRMIAPLMALNPPLGIYFSTGNHEEFTNPTHYIEAITRAGIKVLANQLVTVDGLQIAGVFYHDSMHIIRMKTVLDSLRPVTARASILLNHAPTRLPIVEQAGFSLQLSGHTHGGQFIPYTWITRSIFGRFTNGLHRFGALQVYTSTGAGTWGPPMRVGSQPEIVLLQFE